jgi:hypothetical protein
MPKKEVIDTIAEANGIVFVDGYTRWETHRIHRFSAGKKNTSGRLVADKQRREL